METTLHTDSFSAADVEPLLDRLVTPYLEESYPETFADAQWRAVWQRRLQRWLSDPDINVRLLRGEAWLGFVVCHVLDRDEQRLAEVIEVYVSPGMRRKGLGSHLVEDVMAWAAQHGAREMTIGVRVRNQSAVDFFARLGFAPQRLQLSRWI